MDWIEVFLLAAGLALGVWVGYRLGYTKGKIDAWYGARWNALYRSITQPERPKRKR